MLLSDLNPTALELVVEALRATAPQRRLATSEWFRRYYYSADGQAFDEARVPWVTAPNGPCEAIDNAAVRRLWLQWAARMFKTTFAQGVQMMYADLDPSPMMFATVDQDNCKSVFGRLWRMLEHCPSLRDQLPVDRLQSKTQVNLHRSTIYGAWARGKSKLADKAIRVGHANEIDKWEYLSTSTEGDPLPRFLKRGDEFPDGKFILESTPSVKGRSRVEAGRLASTNCTYWVPCPHCGKFQTLRFGEGKEPPGVYWQSAPDGRQDPDHAYRTAYYVCGHCRGDIHDIHRAEMMGRGVWVPEGCTIDHDRALLARELPPDDRSWLLGEPLRDNQDWGSQISSLYAPFFGWGQIAASFLKVRRSPGKLRQWVNEDAAETWEIIAHKTTWEKLGQKIIDRDLSQFALPAWASLATIGVDRQKDRFVWVVDAWGPGRRSATIHYGEAETVDDVYREAIDRDYRLANGKQTKALFALIDSGFRPEGVYDFCLQCLRAGRQVWPCKGSSSALAAEYVQSRLGKDTSRPGMILVHVDTIRTQGWLDKTLHQLGRDDPGGTCLFNGTLAEHQDFLEQLLNDAPIEKLDGSNNNRESWERIDENIPNDFRDCKRYAYAAMLIVTRGAEIKPLDAPQFKRSAVIAGGGQRPDGRAWIP